MAKVTGLGGVFFKADDPEKMYQWYENHLGMTRENGFVTFQWRDAANPEQEGLTTWAIFKKDSNYFDPSRAGAMINYRVDNLDELLEALRAAGVQIDPKREEYDFGRFAWIFDPEGNKIELWEPR